MGIDVDPASDLSGVGHAELQAIEIIKSLRMKPRLLILDEPTASLSDREAARLRQHLLALKGQKLPILYVTHRMAVHAWVEQALARDVRVLLMSTRAYIWITNSASSASYLHGMDHVGDNAPALQRPVLAADFALRGGRPGFQRDNAVEAHQAPAHQVAVALGHDNVTVDRRVGAIDNEHVAVGDRGLATIWSPYIRMTKVACGWPGWLSRIAEAKLVRSMSRKGYYRDNAACTGFFGRLKIELFFARSW